MESSMVSLVDMIMSVSIENHAIQVTQSGYIKIERPQRHLWIAKNNIYRQNAFFLIFSWDRNWWSFIWSLVKNVNLDGEKVNLGHQRKGQKIKKPKFQKPNFLK